MQVPRGTVIVFSDLGCPWASLAVHRLRARRAALGLAVTLDHRPFPLELFNDRPTPKRVLDAEVAAIAPLEPGLGWRPWPRPDSDYPGSTLLAMEAVQAVKAQSLRLSEDLDAALRHAFYAQGRTISLFTTVLAVARSVAGLDLPELEAALRSGAARAAVFDGWAEAAEVAQGSPHLFLPDGTDVHNPGIRSSWTEPGGSGFVRIESQDPTAYDDALRRAGPVT